MSVERQTNQRGVLFRALEFFDKKYKIFLSIGVVLLFASLITAISFHEMVPRSLPFVLLLAGAVFLTLLSRTIRMLLERVSIKDTEL